MSNLTATQDDFAYLDQCAKETFPNGGDEHFRIGYLKAMIRRRDAEIAKLTEQLNSKKA